nr:TetR/AcrR family transcriptional regulator [Priestia megaterium]
MKKKKTGDPRIRRTIAFLKKSLILLMKEKQIHEITIKDLCEKAGVTRQTFYLRFDDLDQFAHYVSNLILEDFHEKLEVNESQTELKDMNLDNYTIFIRLFEHILDNQAFYESLLAKNTGSPFATGFKKELYHFIEAGLSMVSPNDETIAAPREVIIVYTTAAYFEVIVWWINNNYPYSKEKMAQILLHLSVKGPYK